VTESLNTAVEEWPDDLKCRADRCLKVSEALSLPKKPLSAVTKLVWFLRPEGWTVYDSYAWRGLSCGGNKGEERLREFYCKLHKKKFSHAAARIDGILSDTVWANIAGTRVLDVLMMLNGGLSVTLSDPNARQGFVDALPSGSGRALQDVARRIQEEMADDPFIKFVEQR
jgi:hypothetical protein